MKLRTLALSLALGASLVLGGWNAQAQNTSCSVPPLSYQQTNPVTVVVTDGQAVSFAKATLSNVPAGYIVTNGNYLAWCVEYDALIRVDYPLNPTLYLSTNPALPVDLQSPNWDMVNYILNHKQGTAIDVQNAIWHYIGGPVDPSDSEYYPPSAAALALIADATANGEGFVPAAGQVVAVVMNIPDVEGFYDYQVMIIEASCGQVPVTGCVGDFVWVDTNNNGIQDAGEPGVKDVVVKILDCAGNVLASTLTDANGSYLFSNVPAGSYRIKFALPSGYSFTTQNAGSNDAKDSDADSSGLTACFTLTAGECDYTLDAGLRQVLLRFATYTQGGWGAKPSGNNPGAILSRNWTAVYGSSALVIGGNYTMKFSGASAITDYLPAGGTPSVLKKNYTNPTSTEAGVFGGQVTALRLNVDFSNKGITQPGLASLKIAAGNKFAGYTVAQILALAQQVIGGNLSALPAGHTVSDLNNAADRINNNFDGGSMNLGYLVP